ncbi:MAG: thioredoxin family protein [Bacteroidia bacterium]|nr:thioredoxin family protein [Bacteroidia bacterium]
MKKIIALILISLMTLQTNVQAQDLVGITSLTALKNKPYKTWFNKELRNYSPDKKVITQLQSKLNGVTITVVMATWCGDSKEQVPRFYKVIKRCNYTTNNVTLICTDRSKTTPDHLEEGKNIEKVPTFILYKQGKEIGRIIETPTTTIEADMLKIVN